MILTALVVVVVVVGVVVGVLAAAAAGAAATAAATGAEMPFIRRPQQIVVFGSGRTSLQHQQQKQ